MAAVPVEVNGRSYMVGCEDGQEGHVQTLARSFDAQVQEVAQAVGQLGEARLFLMAALLTADELVDVRARLAQAQAELGRLQSEHARGEAKAAALMEPRSVAQADAENDARIESRAARALDEAAQRVEALADSLGPAAPAA